MGTAGVTLQTTHPNPVGSGRVEGQEDRPFWREALRWATAPFRAARNIVFPPLCLVCDADLSDSREQFCAGCVSDMVPVSQPACRRCALRVGPFVDTSGGCAVCLRDPPRFDAAIRLGSYDGKLRDTCLSFKLVQNELLGPALARLMIDHRGEALSAAAADMVVAVPLHFVRRFLRGFNQAESLARCLAAGLNLPHRSRILKRIRRTRPQSELKRDDRRDNVRAAFQARRVPALKGATILLVDDILTTGATCSEAARALKAAGAARVVVAVIARSQEQPGG